MLFLEKAHKKRGEEHQRLSNREGGTEAGGGVWGGGVESSPKSMVGSSLAFSYRVGT